MNFIQKYKIKISYIVTFFIFFSQGVNPSYLDDKIINIEVIINSIRFFFPSIFLLFIYFFNFEKYRLKYFFNLSWSLKILFYFFVIILIFSLLYSKSYSLNLYFLSYLNIFLLIGLLNYNNNQREIINNLILFILLGLILSILLFAYEILFNRIINFSEFYKLSVLSFDYRFLDQSLPRSTGVSKFILFFLILMVFYSLKNNSIIKFITIIIFSILLFLLNSRTSLIFYFSIIIFLIFYLDQKLRFKIKFFFSTLIIPIVIFICIPDKNFEFFPNKNNRLEIINNLNITDLFKSKKADIFIEKEEAKNEAIKDDTKNGAIKDDTKKKEIKTNDISTLINKAKDPNLTKIENISSGRVALWKKIYNDFKSNKLNFIIGKGILADKKIYDKSSSNGFIYSFLSGGIIGLFFLITLLTLILKKIIIKIIFYKKNNFNNFNDFTYFILLFLIYRLLFENGFLLYISDLYMFSICIFFLNYKKLKK